MAYTFFMCIVHKDAPISTISGTKEGTMKWDGTVKKPLYWNGTAWVYATGTLV